MQTGTVKFFNEQKGYGFIVNDTTKAEVFLHVTGLLDTVKQGDAITYEVKEGKKGLNATNVKQAL
ncbi:MAG: hypothetical protein RI894_659 [Bacteroidota bacterium]|jgi:CspA family cold shock protein